MARNDEFIARPYPDRLNTEELARTRALVGGDASPPAAPSTATLASPVSKNADTSRLRIVSYQKQETANIYNGGETVWLDVAPLAKSMLTWRLPINPATRQVLSNNARPYADSERLPTL